MKFYDNANDKIQTLNKISKNVFNQKIVTLLK